MLKKFNGYLTSYRPDIKDGVPFIKFSITAKESGAGKSILNDMQVMDAGLDGAYNFVNSTGYGQAKYTLDTPYALNVTFDMIEFKADLISVSVKKKIDKDIGDCAEYIFTFSMAPHNDDNKFWCSYLKVKEHQDEPEEQSPLEIEIEAQSDHLLGLPTRKKKKTTAQFIQFPISFSDILGEDLTKDVTVDENEGKN